MLLATRTLIAALLAALVPGGPAAVEPGGPAADEKVRLDHLVPASAIAYVSLDVPELLARLEQTPLAEAWEEEGLDEEWRGLMDKARARLGEAMVDSDLDPDDLDWLFQGEIAFAVGEIDFTRRDDAGRVPLPEMFFLADAGERAESLSAFLAKAIEEAREEGGSRVREEEFRGTTLYVLETPEPDPDAEPDPQEELGEMEEPGSEEEAGEQFIEPEELVVARLGSTFLLTFSLADAREVVLAHAGEDAPSLADQAGYRLIRERTQSPLAFSLYLDTARVLATVRGFIEDEEERAIAEDVIAALGVRDLRCVGGGYDVRADGIWQRFFLHDTGPRSGLLWSLLGSTGPSAPPAFVPADTGQFVVLRVDFTELWASVEELMQIAAETQGVAEDPVEAAEAMLGATFADVFASLGEEIVYVARPFVAQEPAAMTLGFAGIDLALRLKNMETLQALRARLAALAAEQDPAGWPFEEREYLGRILHVMKPGVFGPAPAEFAPSFAITDNLLLFSFSPDRLQAIVRQLGSDAGGIGATAGYKRVAPLVPEQVGLLSYTSGEHVDQGWDQIEQMLAMASGMAGPDQAQEMELLLELFPSLRELLARFDASVGWSQVSDAGCGFTSGWLFEESED